MIRRWGDVEAAIVDAGFGAVDACPMIWRGRVLGGLNVFRGHEPVAADGRGAVCQAFADVAPVVLATPPTFPPTS